MRTSPDIHEHCYCTLNTARAICCCRCGRVLPGRDMAAAYQEYEPRWCVKCHRQWVEPSVSSRLHCPLCRAQ